MNILYISHETTLGGASLALLELIDEMNDKDINIYVSVISNQGSFYEELKKRNVKIICVKYFTDMIYDKCIIKRLNGFLKSMINTISAFKLAKIAKNNKIDIIHTNTSVVLIGAWISKLTGINHVFHIREFSEYKSRKYRLPVRYVNRTVNENSKKIIVISKALYNYNMKNFSTEKIKLIYDGIDISKYNRDNENKYNDIVNKDDNDKTIKILVTGSITENKGQEDAIRALDILVKQGYKNVKLLLAGNKNTDYYNKLINIIKQNNLMSYIEFLGFTKEIEKIRSDIDIELNCSRSEGFGRVTVEAMLSSIAIIGANNTATSELIQDGFNGLLYEEGNINQLSEKIIRLIDNSDERYKLGKNAKEYVLNNFSNKKNADEIYAMYTNLLEGI